MLCTGRGEDGGTGDKLSGNSRSRAEKREKEYKKKPERKGTVQKRKEQVGRKGTVVERRHFLAWPEGWQRRL